jgi:hypothetical protein
MWPMSVKRLLAVAAIALGSVPFLGGSAGALCVRLPPMKKAIEQAPIVFVGTVVEVGNMTRWATVEVEEVWKGNVAARVEVRGGAEDPPGGMGQVSSVDRDYRVDQKYLFAPYEGSGEVFLDNACTATTPYKPSMEAFRPEGAGPPAGGEGAAGRPIAPTSDTSYVPWLVAAGVAALAAGLLAWRFRGRRGQVSG